MYLILSGMGPKRSVSFNLIPATFHNFIQPKLLFSQFFLIELLFLFFLSEKIEMEEGEYENHL